MRFRVTESPRGPRRQGPAQNGFKSTFSRAAIRFRGFAIHLISPRAVRRRACLCRHAPVRYGRRRAGAGKAYWRPKSAVRCRATDCWRPFWSGGYAIATLDAKDFCPDDKQKFREGVLSHLYPGRVGPPGPEEPGAIATWAWGLSRALDYLHCDRDIDPRRVAVIGHSRMGKTALWAGAEDQRFALVISNDSGCGGAALSRRNFGETVKRINHAFPHWFCENFSKYDDHEDQLPVDQHELIALIAPRPVYVASAGTTAGPIPGASFWPPSAPTAVYRLLGKQGLGPGRSRPP